MYKKFIAVSLITIAVVVGAGVITYRYPKVREKITLQGVLKDDFQEFKRARELANGSEKVSMIAVGDIMLSRVVGQKMRTNKNYEYPFLKTAEYLKTADFAFGNLETAITPGREIVTGDMEFRADIETAPVLKKMNFEVVSLANNHTPNFGQKGLKDTFENLDKAGVKFAGAGLNKTAAAAPVYFEKNGFKFAFLAYNDLDVVPKSYFAWDTNAGTNPMYKEEMIEAVKDAKNNADFVIVSMHSGIEYKPHPSVRQTDFAHAAIDAGAELVIGHHPHVIQDVEKYKGKYILYSLGNFVFDQMWSRETREGLTAKIDFTKTGVASINFEPVLIEDYSQPRFLEGRDRENILQKTRVNYIDAKTVFWNKNKKEFSQAIKTVYSNLVEFSKKNIVPPLDMGNYLSDVVVDSEMIVDSNGDGKDELNMSIWRKGDFGPSKPFWVKENDQSIKNHFFVFGLEENFGPSSVAPLKDSIRPIWQSSNLSRPNCEFTFADLDGDKKQELIVTEGEYGEEALVTADAASSYAAPVCIGDHIAIWRWDEWGFKNLWRSEEGSFKNLKVYNEGGSEAVLAE
ncbi:MAG: CapA family protein [Candidatus Gracilibacteria bacterium]|jgi:poly-gamma-glutamate synthesis protein (capsule biosynthesis protein)